MKTMYELRMSEGIDVVRNADSEYKSIDRIPHNKIPLIVPAKI